MNSLDEQKHISFINIFLSFLIFLSCNTQFYFSFLLSLPSSNIQLFCWPLFAFLNYENPKRLTHLPFHHWRFWHFRTAHFWVMIKGQPYFAKKLLTSMTLFKTHPNNTVSETNGSLLQSGQNRCLHANQSHHKGHELLPLLSSSWSTSKCCGLFYESPPYSLFILIHSFL